MPLRCNEKWAHKTSGGFSLVEVLVGMVIGLLGILIMMQMLSVSEGQKNVTTGGNEAQNTGAIALFGLSRSIQGSGYGISSQRMMGCGLAIKNAATLSNIGPVTINPASIPAGVSDAGSDVVMVINGNGNGPEEGDGITSQPAQNTYWVQTQPAYAIYDYVVAQYAVRPSPCSLTLDWVTVAPVPANIPNLQVNTGIANIMNVNTATGITPVLFDLGQSPTMWVYAVQSGNLTVCDYMLHNCGDPAHAADAAYWVPIAGDIVALKAEYGRDTTAPMDGVADVYDQTTPVNNAATASCDWARISALNIALVARGAPGYNVTPNGVNWVSNPMTGATSTIAVNANYRYKVFQTTVPIRNITMQGAISGC